MLGVNSEKNKRKRDTEYEIYLLKVSDPNLIFEYFNKIKQRLPESLHNIMLGYALSKNYNAVKYVKISTSSSNPIESEKGWSP